MSAAQPRAPLHRWVAHRLSPEVESACARLRSTADVAAVALMPDVLDANHTRLWVHRKGAISAAAGEPGIIPGSMGTCSYLVEGRGEPRSLCSSSHGAGRALPRGAAFRTITTRQLRRELRGICYDEQLSERLRDEAPGAYKDIGAVMKAQRELTRIRRRLRPVLVFKGA